MMSGNIEYIRAYTEVNCLLKYFPKEYLDKLPNKLLTMIQEKSNEKYNIVVNVENDLENQNISKKAKDILVVLKYKYWSNASEKPYLMEKFYENEKAFYQEMSRKYNTDNLFQSTKLNEKVEILENEQILKNIEISKNEHTSNNIEMSVNIKTSEKVSMIEYKENIFSKVLKRIKRFFGR